MTEPPLNVIRVFDLDDPRLKAYRNQTDAWLRARHNPDRVDNRPDALSARGVFMAEGALVVEQLIGSRFEVESVLLTPKRLDADARLLAGLGPEVPVYVAEPLVMDRIAGYKVHRGMLACGRRGRGLTPGEALAAAGVCVVMEDLANHDNVGGIFRSVAALAGEGGAILHTGRTCDPLYRKALRVSMGQVLRVPFAEMEGWHGDGVGELRRLGWIVLGLTPDDEVRDVWSGEFRDLVRRSGRVALVVGAEGPGLDEATRDRCDRLVRVPIHEGVDSLNVTVAASIALAEVCRHRMPHAEESG